jgi:hypothetical protein
MPLQQVKIMFTPEAALKINLAVKGSSVTPLDSENQRVFNDVFDHGVNGEFYTIELESGKGFSYPNRNIERIRSAWQDEPFNEDDEALQNIFDEIDGQLEEQLDQIDRDYALAILVDINNLMH